MAERGLQDLIALHEQLATLDEAGVRIDLGVPPGRVRIWVTQLGQEMAGGVGRGDSLEDTLRSEESEATPAYRRLATAWLAGAELDDLLSSSCRNARLDAETQRLSAGLLYPVLIALAAFVGLAAMVHFVLPHVEAAYADLDEPVGGGIALLQSVRKALPLIAIVVPLVLAAVVYGVFHAKPPRLTGHSREVGVAARARFARATEVAGELIDAGMPTGEALQQVGLPDPNAPHRRLPPLINWAISSIDERPAAADDLHAIGTLYTGMATRGARRFATLTPAVACVVIGGGATLVYALALFVPVVEMLWTFAICPPPR